MEENNKDNQINIYKENYLLNSVFIKDTEFQYIFKKTEKIVTAIYLVTNFLTTEEPVKWSLRNASTSLLKSAMTFSKMSLSDREMRVHELNSAILETSSLFDLAFRSGFVSNMNYDIINFEISKLAASVSQYQSGNISSNKGLFDENYFEVHKDNSVSESDAKNDFDSRVNLKDKKIKDTSKSHNFVKGHSNDDLYKTNNSKRETTNSTSNSALGNTSNVSNKSKSRPKKTNIERRNIIISEIKKHGEVSIKEIEKALPNLSSKTLQRELLSMVDESLIVKKGERRWSRYSLNN